MNQGFASGVAVALAFGAGDFFQGVGARRASVLAVLVWGQGGALVVLTVLAVATGKSWAIETVPLGVGIGLAAAVGTSLLLLGFARGSISIVSPAASLTAAGLPLAIDAATGTQPSVLHYFGFVLALAAVWLIAYSPSEVRAPGPPLRASGLIYGLGAGMAHGVMYVLLDQTETGSILATLVIAYVALVAVGIVAALVTRSTIGIAPRHVVIVFVAGFLGAAGTGLFVFAAAAGSVGTAAVVAETSPALTAILARVVLREPIPPPRVLGIGLAVAAVVLLST